MTPMPRLRILLVLPLLLLGALAVPETASAAEKLALRTNDAEGVPGGVVAVVVRTYASRAIGQGQILFRSGGLRTKAIEASKRRGRGGEGEGEGGGSGPSGPSPFVALESFVVFSARQDARFQGSFDTRRATLSFNSPSRTINSADGPLAIFYFRLADWVQPGQVYEIGIDPGTTLVDDKGRRVQVEPRNGELEIVADTGAQELEVEPTGVVKPGRMAIIGLETKMSEPLGSGRIGFRYDKSIARKPPFVRVDPRMGNVRFNADVSTPGLVLITFDSTDGSFNRFPGAIFEVRIPTGKWVRRGTRAPLTLDPSLTFLVDREGDVLDLELENGTLIFR
ncbi:MAG TPA: hypothetical protein VEL74_01070 [Thermoanaerobaculia bacterium]|nr:hypothetical protein [Thermoanaerobaculia bacterium]